MEPVGSTTESAQACLYLDRTTRTGAPPQMTSTQLTTRTADSDRFVGASRRTTAPTQGRRRSPMMALAALLGLSLIAAACSSSPASSSATSAGPRLVSPPDVTVQGCTYAPNGSIPPGATTGIDPRFAPFSPDQAATAALGHIKAHGGTGLVYGYSLPTGTQLFAGPDATASPVATVTAGRSMSVSDPVLWTTASGARWLAFFIACGGTSPYWASVSQVAKTDTATGTQLRQSISALLAAPPYTSAHKASALPIKIDAQHHLVWVDPKVRFAVGRGELVAF